MSKCLRAFLILALVFLVLGLGTLGSARSTGKAYALAAKRATDGKEPCIVLRVSAPEKSVGENSDFAVKEVYLNFGAIYTDFGGVVTFQIARGTNEDSSWYSSVDIKLANFYENTENESSSSAITDSLCNWIRYDVGTTDGWDLSTYPFYRIKVTGGSVLINEIVFVAYDVNAGESAKPVILNASVHAGGNNGTLLPYDSSLGETAETAIERAGAIVDSPCIPSMAQSSFFRLGQEEIWSMMTISEMRLGNTFV